MASHARTGFRREWTAIGLPERLGCRPPAAGMRVDWVAYLAGGVGRVIEWERRPHDHTITGSVAIDLSAAQKPCRPCPSLESSFKHGGVLIEVRARWQTVIHTLRK